ncbi:hypothetical protein [Brevibacillus daliensis]|uniref:hypothetical protein n=1 Tax=Brevibacillus daliensis TaxID=2892995 RepID=UPI001E4109FC|nr:hypothetical protein [Brevibacillus daliensis]
MKKKLIMVLSGVLVAGIATSVYANGIYSEHYQQMKPYMQQMHPEMSDGQIEQMYRNCHGQNVDQSPQTEQRQMYRDNGQHMNRNGHMNGIDHMNQNQHMNPGNMPHHMNSYQNEL